MENIEDKLTNEEFRIYSIIKNGVINNLVSYGVVYDKDGVNLTRALNRILDSLADKGLIKWEYHEEYIQLIPPSKVVNPDPLTSLLESECMKDEEVQIACMNKYCVVCERGRKAKIRNALRQQIREEIERLRRT